MYRHYIQRGRPGVVEIWLVLRLRRTREASGVTEETGRRLPLSSQPVTRSRRRGALTFV